MINVLGIIKQQLGNLLTTLVVMKWELTMFVWDIRIGVAGIQ